MKELPEHSSQFLTKSVGFILDTDMVEFFSFFSMIIIG